MAYSQLACGYGHVRAIIRSKDNKKVTEKVFPLEGEGVSHINWVTTRHTASLWVKPILAMHNLLEMNHET